MEEMLNKIPSWVSHEDIMGYGWVEVDGRRYQYHILRKEKEPRLPGFVGFPKAEFLFISEEVPGEYRPFILTHEAREYTTYAGQPGRCAMALRRELGEVPRAKLPAYIKYRLDRFEHLAAFLEEHGEDAGLQIEVAKSVLILQSMAAALEDEE